MACWTMNVKKTQPQKQELWFSHNPGSAVRQRGLYAEEVDFLVAVPDVCNVTLCPHGRD